MCAFTCPAQHTNSSRVFWMGLEAGAVISAADPGAAFTVWGRGWSFDLILSADCSSSTFIPHAVYNNLFSPFQVLITIYWLGRRSQCDGFYDGSQLNLKAFEGLLGTALYKVKQWMIIPSWKPLKCDPFFFYGQCPAYFCILPRYVHYVWKKGRLTLDFGPLKPNPISS